MSKIFQPTGFTISVLAICISAPSFAQSTCASVYQNAVSNVHASSVVETERSYYFNLYCEQSGSTRDWTSSAAAKFPVKGVPVAVAGDGNLSLNDVKKFCRVGAEEKYYLGAVANFDRVASVAALQSFNQCREIEERSRALIISHADAPPHSFLINADFTNNNSRGTLDSVQYPEDLMTCTSQNFTDSSTPEILHGAQAIEIGTEDFTITCERTPQVFDGETFYPYATAQFGTSWGTYTVTLPGDKHYGFELASQAETTHAEIVSRLTTSEQQSAAYKAEADRLTRRTNGALLQTVYLGDGGWQGPREHSAPCGTVIDNAYGQGKCAAQRTDLWSLKVISQVGGGACGHTWYALLCAPSQ